MTASNAETTAADAFVNLNISMPFFVGTFVVLREGLCGRYGKGHASLVEAWPSISRKVLVSP